MGAVRRQARGIRVTGTVQGVGFRRSSSGSAMRAGPRRVGAERRARRAARGRGRADAVESFARRLAAEAPPLAERRGACARDDAAPTGERGVPDRRRRRAGGERARRWSRPTSATCDDCLAELLDPADRRHRYPFINCTNCGPRFTIVRGVPYDRPLTTMAGFEMCDACRAEYEDPRDRRFHAQPNACPRAAPLRGWSRPADADALGRRTDAVAARRGAARRRRDPRRQGARRLPPRVPGADAEAAVAALRARKHREDKPFALMAPDLAAARGADRAELRPTRSCSRLRSARS